MNQHSRRRFLKNTICSAAAVSLSPLSLRSKQGITTKTPNDGLVFLFQGDSITDGNRGRNADPNHLMGHGYAFSIASRIGADFPLQGLQFFNRGISGNKVSDLKARWQEDTLDLKRGLKYSYWCERCKCRNSKWR